MILNIGAGCSGVGEKQIDLFDFPNITEVLDVAVRALPYARDTFDEVRCEQVLEHIPTQLRWVEKGQWHLRFCRVELMKEIYRVLKPGGVLHASVPVGYPEKDQDPTHTDVPWNREAFSYFCGQWGGNEPGKEATESSGINFAFEWERDFLSFEGKILTVRLRKPSK